MRKWVGAAAVVLLVTAIIRGITGLFPLKAPSNWEGMARAYGAGNGVAAVVLGSRLYDTLLEVLVFALAVAGVKGTLAPLGRWRERKLPERGVVREMADLLLPVVSVFSVYLAASGHLGPGGGFPAGAILGSGLLLLALAKGMERLKRELPQRAMEGTEYGAIVAFISLGGIAAMLGWRGAGLLIVYNMLIGMEVAAGTWVVLRYFATHRGEI